MGDIIVINVVHTESVTVTIQELDINRSRFSDTLNTKVSTLFFRQPLSNRNPLLDCDTVGNKVVCKPK